MVGFIIKPTIFVISDPYFRIVRKSLFHYIKALKSIRSTEYNRTRLLFPAFLFPFRVIARPQRGRGNLKVIDVESHSEARERKTTKSRIFDLSLRDTDTALLRKHHFTRAQARISHAKHLSHDQRSYFTAQP